MEKSTKNRFHRKHQLSKKRTKPIWLAMAAIAACMAVVALWQAYLLMGCNLTARDGEEHDFYIYPETTVNQLLDSVKVHYNIHSTASLYLHAFMMHWPQEGQTYVRTGYYKLPARMGDKLFIRKFRNGEQSPVRVSFSNVRTQGQLAARLSAQLMIDSAAIASRLSDPTYMEQFQLDVPNAVCLFLPNTYELYWDITADALFQRMKKEHDAFWTEERRAKANKMGFTPEEIATIASIVEEETNLDRDKPIVAGLYINRVRKHMKLEACPTVKFALQDFGLRRILNKHLEVDSPYNTYKVIGLPPGPIRIPTAKTLDITLNPTESDYLYMCASAAFDGSHKFAATYSQHLANAREYQAALNARGIK